ncbi:transcription factor E2F8-like [Chelonus insularis]|uniref:transcription factor E2F8-like n=1 Tax=Chelonus insularis TaxID=460826 RepID=UPI00158BA5A7|nr:transcription factor E2F8-like [Chelonus insularis]XP_034949993.1 transcription factor E2F8-like [Chelonus insularis]
MSEIGPSTPDRIVLGELINSTKLEPISPTANLRLLTSLASNLKSVSRSDRESQNKIQVNQCSPIASGSVDSKTGSRKQKSLKLICENFLGFYRLDVKNDVVQEIHLDSTAKSLGTEKRRIYDIINILESLDMASKAGKNRYLWHGQNNLTSTLATLKSRAINLGLKKRIQDIQKTDRSYIEENDDNIYCNNESITLCEELADEKSYDNETAIKEDKSLGAMCRKFIMLFLVSMKNGVINLDIAEKVLISELDTPEKLNTVSRSHRTKVRRLYDIANVLTAIGLIKKVSLPDRNLKKPIFKYTGPEIESTNSSQNTPIHQIYDSPIKMTTPKKHITPLSEQMHINSLINSDFKNLSNISHSVPSTGYSQNTVPRTPLTDGRRYRKRKLFESDTSFPKIRSLPNLDRTRLTEGLDDSLCRVVEMEYEKMNSNNELQEPKPKACTKLFPKFNSDSCLKITNRKTVKPIQVSGEMRSLNHIISISDKGNATTITFENSPPMSQTPIKNKTMQPISLAAIIIANANQILIPHNTSNIKKNHEKVCNNKNQTEVKSVKTIKIPASTAKPQQVAIEKTSNSDTNYVKVPVGQASKLSPGDILEVVQAGETLQLVTIKTSNSFKNR